MRLKVAEGGRIVIPAEYRRALGVETGDEVILQLDNGELRLFTPEHAIRRAQELVKQFVSPDYSLADELIAERKVEGTRE